MLSSTPTPFGPAPASIRLWMHVQRAGNCSSTSCAKEAGALPCSLRIKLSKNGRKMGKIPTRARGFHDGAIGTQVYWWSRSVGAKVQVATCKVRMLRFCLCTQSCNFVRVNTKSVRQERPLPCRRVFRQIESLLRKRTRTQMRVLDTLRKHLL